MAENIKMWFKFGINLGILHHSWTNRDKSNFPENVVIQIDQLLENLISQTVNIITPTRQIINFFKIKMYRIYLKIEEIERNVQIEE